MTREKDRTIAVTCPRCRSVVRVSEREAERAMTVRCPQGHDVPLVKAV